MPVDVINYNIQGVVPPYKNQRKLSVKTTFFFPSPEEREYRERWNPFRQRGRGISKKVISLLEVALKPIVL